MAWADTEFKPLYLGNFESVIFNKCYNMLSIAHSFKQNYFETEDRASSILKILY